MATVVGIINESKLDLIKMRFITEMYFHRRLFLPWKSLLAFELNLK